MNKRHVSTIIRHDISLLLQDKRAVIPMFIFQLIMFAVLPLTALSATSPNIQVMLPIGSTIPESYDPLQRWMYGFLNFYVPCLYMVVPVLIANNVCGTLSFAAEKQRKTLEGLMSLPIRKSDLIIAKVLSSVIPTIVCSFVVALFYGAIVDTYGYGRFNNTPIFPNPIWVLLVLVAMPLMAVFSALIMIIISEEAKTPMDAQGVGLLILMPFSGIVIAIFTILLSVASILVFSLVLAIIDVIVFMMAMRKTDSEDMLLS